MLILDDAYVIEKNKYETVRGIKATGYDTADVPKSASRAVSPASKTDKSDLSGGVGHNYSKARLARGLQS